MYKTLILVAAILLSTRCFCQLDSAVLKKMADKVEASFEMLNDEEFGPVRLSYANMYALLPDFNEQTTALRKLLSSGKFKTSAQLFNWLLPVVDKMALQQYINNNQEVNKEYVSMYSKMSVASCSCFETLKKAGLDNVYTDSASLKCLGHIWTDTTLMQLYRAKLTALDDNGKVALLTGLMRYTQVNCEAYFNNLVKLSVTRLPDLYDKEWQNMKVATFFRVLHYNIASNDSLQLVFPANKQFLPQLQQLAAIFKKYPHPQLPTQALTQQPAFDRFATFITQYNNDKPYILAQVVYEVSNDKLLPYVTKITVYGRENLQNIERLEQSLPPLKKKE